MTHLQPLIPAYVCLGSNLGDTEGNLAHAIERLGEVPGLTVDAVSAVYFTEPQDVKNQPWFANRVARVLCEGKISPQGLLDELLRVEAELGRVRGEGVVRFGPRVIDLDLLLYGDAVMETETLTLPHPRMRQRAFVLVPLADVAPDLRFPDGDTLRDALARLSYRVDNFRIWQD